MKQWNRMKGERTTAAEPQAPSPIATEAAAAKQGCISSKLLFSKGRRDLLIDHEGSLYRLTLTRQNKLILTK